MTGSGESAVTDAGRQREQEQQLAALREKHPQWRIFRIAGGWGAVREHLESARTANTLDELAGKLAKF
jgi:hypothetical protein